MTSFERFRPLWLAAGRAMNRVFDVVLGVAPPQQWDTMLAKGQHMWGKYNDVHRHCPGCTDPIPTPPEELTPRTWREQWLIGQGMQRLLTSAEHRELAGLRGTTPQGTG